LIIRVSERFEETVCITQVNSSSRLAPRDGEIGETGRAAKTRGSVEIAMRILLQVCGEGERAIDGACIARPAGTIDCWNEVGEKCSTVTTIARATDGVAAADCDPIGATRHHNRVWTIAFSNRKINGLLIDSAGQGSLAGTGRPIEEDNGRGETCATLDEKEIQVSGDWG